MLLLIVSFSILICAHGAVLSPILDGRIVGGSPAEISEAPYQISLLLDYWGVGSFAHGCGGSIININTVITAAHCTIGSNPEQWRIRAGSTFHNSGGQVIPVNRIVQHVGFNSRVDNDISLIFLANNLTFGSNIAAVNLPIQGQTVPDGSPALVTGWGALSEGGNSPIQLYKVTVPIVNHMRCVRAYRFFNPVTARMICAGRLGIGGQDACQGDSGGPLTVNGTLIGISSWGRGCGQPEYPGVYTRVPSFRNWINSNI